MISYSSFLVHSDLICKTIFLSCASFNLYLILEICSSISLRNFGSNIIYLMGLSKLIGVFIFFHITLQMFSSPKRNDAHFCIQTLPSTCSIPNWMDGTLYDLFNSHSMSIGLWMVCNIKISICSNSMEKFSKSLKWT